MNQGVSLKLVKSAKSKVSMQEVNQRRVQYLKNLFNRERAQLREIGRESEYPIVDSDGNWVNTQQGIMQAIAQNGFHQHIIPGINGTHVVQLTDRKGRVPSWIINDASAGTIEIVQAPTKSLFEAQKLHDDLLSKILPVLDDFGCHLLGAGSQPVTLPSADLWLPLKRYSSLVEAMGEYIHWATVCTCEQTHVDVYPDEIVDAYKVLNALSGVKIGLLANNPIVGGKVSKHLAFREGFWDLFAQGRMGVPENCPESIEDIVWYMLNLDSIAQEQADGTYVALMPALSQQDFATMDDFLRAFYANSACVWNSARLRFRYQTIESRSSCQQLPGNGMVSSAIDLGLVENNRAAVELVHSYEWKDFIQFRLDSRTFGLKAPFAGSHDLVDEICYKTLEIAQEGLHMRAKHVGEDESIFLKPAFERLKSGKTQAEEVLEYCVEDDGTVNIQKFIERCAYKMHHIR